MHFTAETQKAKQKLTTEDTECTEKFGLGLLCALCVLCGNAFSSEQLSALPSRQFPGRRSDGPAISRLLTSCAALLDR